jgi:hypothetical protein
MAENKTRSKSIGRAPSRNFKSLDAFKSKVLKHVGKEYLNVESDEEEPIDIAVVDCKVKKMSTLGELSSELEKKKIDGDNLDRIMKELFSHYNTEQDKIDNIVSERFLMLNTCRNHKDLYPPINLKTTNKTVDLDKLNKLQRVFQNIPIFTNDKNYTIRELLNGMNSIVENLGFQISESEYELILNQKLSPRVKSAVRGYKHDNLKGLFANLLNIYDSSESHHEAFSALVSQKNKFNNLHEFMEENLRLLSLSRKNSDQQSQLFVHSVQHILPKRVFEKLLEFLDSYEIIHKGKYPELPTLVDFIYKFKSEVDAHMAKNYKGPKYNFAQTNESEDEDETSGNNSFPSQKCSICNKNNHSTEKCFKTKQCNNCNSMGHIERYCNREKKCSKCNKSGHTVTTCFIRCRLCNSPAHGAVNCNIYPGIEPAQIACTNCSKSLFIKLYHPTNKCKIQKN